MKKLFKLKANSVKMEYSFLMSIFRLYPGLKLSHNSSRTNLSADFRCDARLFVRETDQKLKFWWNLWLWGSYLEFFSLWKFRPHAIIHDAGAVQSPSGKSLGYRYIFGPGSDAVLLAHVIGIFSCLPLSTLSNFEAVCLALYYTSSVQISTKLGSWEFFSQKCSGKTHLVFQKSTNPRTERFGVQKSCTEMCRTVDVWVTVSLQTNFLDL